MINLETAEGKQPEFIEAGKKQLEGLKDKLIHLAKKVDKGPWETGKFSENARANEIINNIKTMPHVFVMACMLGRQFQNEKAWETLAELEARIGLLDIEALCHLSQSDWNQAFSRPTTLHRFPNEMARYVMAAVHRIAGEYGRDASRIWSDSPSSSTVIKRFMEFEGIGQKISVMAANILARYFKVSMSDYYSIDITVDGRMKRVLSRMGVVESKNPLYIQMTMREMYPQHPGIFDPVLWEIGKFHCFATEPDCPGCPVNKECLYSRTRDENLAHLARVN